MVTQKLVGYGVIITKARFYKLREVGHMKDLNIPSVARTLRKLKKNKTKLNFRLPNDTSWVLVPIDGENNDHSP